MNEIVKACIGVNEKILKDVNTSVKVNIPTLDLERIFGYKNFIFNPFK